MAGFMDEVLEAMTKKPEDAAPEGNPAPAPGALAPETVPKKELFKMGDDWEKQYGPRKKA